MRDYLIIDSNTIVKIVTKENVFKESDYSGIYDTVAETVPGLFKEGEIYSITEYTKRMESRETIEEKRAKMQMTRDQADIALILLGWEKRMKEAVFNSDDLSLKYTSRIARKHTRICEQTVE